MNLFLRRWHRWVGPPRVDVPLLVALLLLVGIGLAVLHSAAGGNERLVWSQAARMGVGLIALWVISRIPPVQMRLWTPWLFAASLLLLALVPFLGTGRSGRHWLNLGVFYVQPAELLKLTVPMVVAAFLHARPLPPSWTAIAVSGVLVGVPCALIAIQPDLGTALLVGASGAFVVFLSGMAWWRIGLLAGLAAAALPLAWPFLREYQKQRLLTFMSPEADPLGSGWNIIQSKIAVGSGGVFGKGWGQGTQSRLEFLPEHTTDFIFAVLGEEFGLVGVLVILALYLFIIGRCLWIAANARDTYARLLGGALALTFFVYVIVNGGMVSGLLPVVGVPMPLLSYGGTSAVTLLAGFGIVMSIHAHRKFMG
ncbi:rod shape-determining protein RodA [Chiayiivirga flava]|uniref:Peptidoglycan glycosyltransferase MrdB n=1 Tax=Chiayiivirga flava TaxID=659595 RepID=A0A7W8D3W1_9GAMM|nr:rod shape-determining protein RodA [Chiayiivirga flava]MBB5207434.1 rod shape determining protein RodA [Chiayiivirga flava]